MVVAKYLFVNVARQMKRLYSNVGSAKAAFQQRPEVFHTIDVHLSANIALGLVHNIVNKSPLHSVVVGDGVIRIDSAAILHVLKNLVLQGLASNARYNRGANLAKISVKDAMHD